MKSLNQIKLAIARSKFLRNLLLLWQEVRFKTIDWYVFKAYIGPFFLTFFIAWFVFIMQFLWVYIDDMIGKGISTYLIVKFLSIYALTLIPGALPLAVLLSSIMTMGKFGENYELTSAKSSGISLFRFFRSMIFFSIFVSIFAFYFSNYIYTKSKSVAQTMLADIRTLKPSFFIKPKQFYNGISGMVIRVEDKDEKTGMLYNVKIYNHTKGVGNQSVLMAKRGNLAQSEDGTVLIFKMDTGIMYNDEATNSFDNLKYPFFIWKFEHYEKRFDLTQFQMKENGSKNPDEARLTMNMVQLNRVIDSIDRDIQNKNYNLDTNFQTIHPILKFKGTTSAFSVRLIDSLSRLEQDDKSKFKIITANKLRNVKNYLYSINSELKYEADINNLFRVERHRKFTLAISCLVLFFVGAPLGAIIKKGGIGLPVFISIILFIIYYMMTKVLGEMAEAQKLPAFLGMWASTMLFLPFGIFLTYKAMNDSQLMNIEGFSNMIYQRISKFKNAS